VQEDGHGRGDAANTLWASLDAAWLEAFDQAWEAFRTGNIAVGACASTPDGRIVGSSRNRVADSTGPVGEVFGSTVAHAEINVLARLEFRRPRELTLTTTLQPCLKCAAAIRMGPIATVRVAGHDPLWDGCDDFTSMSPWLARRDPAPSEGPRRDEIGAFGTLISRFGLGLLAPIEDELRRCGQGPSIDLAQRLEAEDQTERLAALDVGDAFVSLWDDLQAL
jgi:tRNA(Arg) A34 adenosine deaminase TadA